MQTINKKYVKQTYDMLSDNRANLELIAIQIGELPVREQNKFIRLALNYIDITANKTKGAPIGLKYLVKLCNRIMDAANDHVYESEEEVK